MMIRSQTTITLTWVLAAEAPNASGQVLNIGCGRQTSLNEVLRVAAEFLNCKVSADYMEARAGDVRHSLADIDLARHFLGYEPEVSFNDGLARTIDAMRDRTSNINN